MIRPILLFISLMLAVPALQAQTTINGVTLPAELSYSGETFALNGGGVRTKLIFNLYVGGLYLESPSGNASAIVDGDAPMAVRLVITSNKINSNNMSEAIAEGFEKSTDGHTGALEARIDKLVKTFSADPIEVNDIFDLVYVPGKGVLSYKNGKLAATIEGLDFKQALFGIWLSENPVSGKLKSGMLGE